MKEIAVRFSGGKDSMLAAMRIAPDFDRVHLLTFGHQMIANLDKAEANVRRLAEVTGSPDKFLHTVCDITPIIRHFYEGKGYVQDVRNYGTLARAGTCTACDFSMFVRTMMYCIEHDIPYACDGGNRSEFSGFLDEWGLEMIQQFSSRHGIEWFFPVFETERCDITLLKEGLKGDNPTVLYGQQACCRGVGFFSNIHLRTYYLPRYGVEKYQEMTRAWLEERFQMADDFLRDHLGRTRVERPVEHAAAE